MEGVTELLQKVLNKPQAPLSW
ncbi:hypothetical protein [Pseudomonas cichorii]